LSQLRESGTPPDGFATHIFLRQNNEKNEEDTRHCYTNTLATFAHKGSLDNIEDVTLIPSEPRISHNFLWTQINTGPGSTLMVANGNIVNYGQRKEWPAGEAKVVEAWTNLLDDTKTMMSKGFVVIMMDSNAHTNTANDGCPIPRKNEDVRPVDRMGRHLLAFCIASGLMILNGRSPSGEEGKSTRNGADPSFASVIDMVLISPELLPFCRLRVVDELHHLPTDHKMILLTLTQYKISLKKPKPKGPANMGERLLTTLALLEDSLIDAVEWDKAETAFNAFEIYDHVQNAVNIAQTTANGMLLKKPIALLDQLKIHEDEQLLGARQKKLARYDPAYEAKTKFPSCFPIFIAAAKSAAYQYGSLLRTKRKSQANKIRHLYLNLSRSNDTGTLRQIFGTPSKYQDALASVPFAETQLQQQNIPHHFRIHVGNFGHLFQIIRTRRWRTL
jgi:hypothetical protein